MPLSSDEVATEEANASSWCFWLKWAAVTLVVDSKPTPDMNQVWPLPQGFSVSSLQASIVEQVKLGITTLKVGSNKNLLKFQTLLSRLVFHALSHDEIRLICSVRLYLYINPVYYFRVI